MPSFLPITVNDREDTPVSHTFSPQLEKNNVFYFHERDGIPLGDKQLTLSVQATANGNYKARLRIADPVVVVETINSVDVPKVDRTAYASVEFTFSNRSSEQERENLIGMLANALADSQTLVMGVCRDLESVY